MFCEYNSEHGEHDFGKINTTPQDMHDMFVDKDPDRVVMEICSVAGWIVDIAKALGIDTAVANTTHDAWRWKNVKKKNDREDALKLAKLSAMHQLPKVHIPVKAVREHRALIEYRQRLVRQRVGIKNAIRAIFTSQGMSMLKESKRDISNLSMDRGYEFGIWREFGEIREKIVDNSIANLVI